MRELSFPGPYKLKLAASISDFSPEDWNSLTGAETLPFLEWEWLAALEQSGSAAAETGWRPLHLSLWEKDKLLAAAPLYLKNHSDGEFIWDYFWAEAAASMGCPWYPKLVGTIPATPAEGYRFLTAPGGDGLNALLLDAAEGICRNNGIPALHLLFADPGWAALPGSLLERGYTGWKHSRFAWENAVPPYPPSAGAEGGGKRPFAGFADYLSYLNKNERKNIRREYGRHKEQRIRLKIVEGSGAPAEYFTHIYNLYSITNDKFIPWDARWVNRDFFRLLEKNFRSRTVFSQAVRGEEIVALAMMFRKGGRIWGRYWGAYEEVKDLHFSVCYYAPMDYCIAENIGYFDPGIGSPHKIRRGFRASFDHSYHKFFHPLLETLFKTNIAAVNEYEQRTIDELNAVLPFKKPPSGGPGDAP
ncbi:MAG: GNAT family N-acetyltransferase [Treponema sp.]|jgi:predicted N-acyltransferase|nr:GNAT family N-acetyltransferase [Treponema sp.]